MKDIGNPFITFESKEKVSEDDFNIDMFYADWGKLRDKVRKHRKFLITLQVLGNLAIIFFLIQRKWFTAFVLFVMFCPDLKDTIIFFKRLLKSLHSSKDKESHHKY